MIKKILIILCYNSRRITVGIIGLYFLALLVLRNRYYEVIQKFDLPVFFLLLGFYLGLNLMTYIIRFLNKQTTKEHPTFKRLTSKRINNANKS